MSDVNIINYHTADGCPFNGWVENVSGNPLSESVTSHSKFEYQKPEGVYNQGKPVKGIPSSQDV